MCVCLSITSLYLPLYFSQLQLGLSPVVSRPPATAMTQFVRYFADKGVRFLQSLPMNHWLTIILSCADIYIYIYIFYHQQKYLCLVVINRCMYSVMSDHIPHRKHGHTVLLKRMPPSESKQMLSFQIRKTFMPGITEPSMRFVGLIVTHDGRRPRSGKPAMNNKT